MILKILEDQYPEGYYPQDRAQHEDELILHPRIRITRMSSGTHPWRIVILRINHPEDKDGGLGQAPILGFILGYCGYPRMKEDEGYPSYPENICLNGDVLGKENAREKLKVPCWEASLRASTHKCIQFTWKSPIQSP